MSLLMTMTKTALLPLANGFEEIEAACCVDILRRAGVQVTQASVSDSLQVCGAHDIKWQADCLIDSCVNHSFDLIVLPGGMPGATNLRDSTQLTALIKKQAASGRLYAAICASPAVVLAHHGLLERKKATCYQGFENALLDKSELASRVVIDGNCVTSQSPLTAIEFAQTLAKLLVGERVSI